MHKNFRNDIWTGLCARIFQSYKFKWHVLVVKIFRQRSILTNLFGHLMTSEVKGHLEKKCLQACEIQVQKANIISTTAQFI